MPSAKYKLQQVADQLALVHKTSPKIKPITINFAADAITYRRKFGGGRNQAIAKACGIKSTNNCLRIIDATAGLGKDAFILASLNCQVHLIEQCPTIAALLQDGIQRGKTCAEIIPIISKMQFTEGNAIEIMTSLPLKQYPDVVYLDPMFPDTNKTALVKKEMRAIRDIINDFNAHHNIDDSKNNIQLFNAAQQVAKKRIVVKRPKVAPTLTASKPDLVLKGKSNRFDVYLML